MKDRTERAKPVKAAKKSPAKSKEIAGLRRRLGLARLALFWEAAWPALWPILGVGLLFAALALFDVLPALPGWAHLIVLLLMVAGLGLAVIHAVRTFRLPDEAAARRRIEANSGLDHRPLTVAEDDIAVGKGDPVSEAVWAAHRRRMLEMIGKLKIGAPSPGLPARDPWALRIAVLLLLVVGATLGWRDAPGRFERALKPQLTASAATLPATVDLWLTPPSYTRLAPKVIKFSPEQAVAKDTIKIPRGSKLLAQLFGGHGTPKLSIGGKTIAFEDVGGGNHQATAAIEEGGVFTISQGGRTVASGTIKAITDQPPVIVHAQPPSGTARNSLKLEYAATDDFGVVKVTARITRAGGGLTVTKPDAKKDKQDKNAEPPIVLELPVPGVSVAKAHSVSFHDLTAHVWAGMEVEVVLTAEDGLGQKGISDKMRVLLPKREFFNPVAQAIIAAREALTRYPGKKEEIAITLLRLAARPKAYHHDVVVFLGLKTAHDRLRLDRTKSQIRGTQALLWRLALRVEDGALSDAERNLRQVQKELEEALSKNASEEEIKKLLDRLQRAMDEYFKAIAEDMKKHPEKYANSRQIPSEQMMRMDRQDLQSMLDKLRRSAETGAKDAARQLLSQLRNMMENLRIGKAPQPNQGPHPADKLMGALEDLIKQQQQLLDQTFRKSQQGQYRGRNRGEDGPRMGPSIGERLGQPRQNRPDQQGQQGRQGQGQQGQRRQGQQGQLGQGKQGKGGFGTEAERQEALRRGLGAIMDQLGEMTGNVPQAMGEAELSMRNATRNLRKGAPGPATDSQAKALDKLRSGMKQAMQQLMKRFGGQPGMVPGRRQARRDGRDPLGRNTEGNGRAWGSDVKVPDESELQRAREILDELRKRAGEHERPKKEREYIDRLLPRF